MKQWLNNLSEKTAKKLALCLLTLGILLLAAALWITFSAKGDGYTLTTYSMGFTYSRPCMATAGKRPPKALLPL